MLSMTIRQILDKWPADSHRLRLLVEDPDPALAVSDFVEFRMAGFDVAVCSGPRASPCECPLLRDGVCGLVDECDVLLFGLSRSTMGSGSVLRAVRHARPDLPVLVRDIDAAVPLPTGCKPLPRETSVSGQLRALRNAAARSRAR